jgi:hypothetical protein
MLVVGEGIERAWLCHLDCVRDAAHPSFASRFAKLTP